MNKNKLNEIIKKVSEISGIDEEEIDASSHIYDDLNLGTEEIDNLITELSDNFGIELSESEVEVLETIDDIFNVVKEKTDEL